VLSKTRPTSLPPEESSLYAFDAAWVLGRRGPLAGADEAGRGALAGPLVASAVVLGDTEVSGINDSKLLRPSVREEIFDALLRKAEAISVVAYPAWWIDRHGVGVANREALNRALDSLRSRARSAAVAAASVVAKVLRDDAMRALSETHNGYGFGRNRGYGTPEHRLALSELGPCRVHRLSYAGVGV
jgi:ribonuclease HII